MGQVKATPIHLKLVGVGFMVEENDFIVWLKPLYYLSPSLLLMHTVTMAKSKGWEMFYPLHLVGGRGCYIFNMVC